LPVSLAWRWIAAAFVAAAMWTADDRPPEPESPPPAAVPAPPPAGTPPSAGTTAPSEPPAPQPGPAGAASDQESLLKAYFETGLDTDRGFSVTNLVFKKDAVTLTFKQGSLFLLKPIDGQVTGAVFIGDGLIGYTPPNRTERVMIRKYAGA
jgi:hypothetical protein